MSSAAETQEQLSRTATALFWAIRALETSASSLLLGHSSRSQEYRRALAHAKAAQQSVEVLLKSFGVASPDD